MTTITALPTAPSRTDPSTFSARADALLGALDQFVTETNAVAGEVNANATIATTQAGLATTNGAAQVALAAAQVSLATDQVALATTQAGIATTQATAAAASALVAGATLWVSGTTYAIGNARYSPANGQTYRRLTAGAGTTDPSADTTNWVIVNGITSEAILLTTNNLPTVRPTLNLDFANSKIVDPRITFTRASTATRTNEKGLLETVASGAPRIDYDPVTLACKGLLVEESRTNLLTYSEQFDNAAWTKSRTTISANAATAPDGAVTADTIIEDTTASNTHQCNLTTSSLTSGTAYTVSLFVKAASGTRYIALTLGGTAYASAVTAVFTLNESVAPSVTGSGTGAIQNVGNGWFRVSLTATAQASGTAQLIYYLSNAATAGGLTYTGDGTSGIYIWGAQLEAGSFATSYIPTTSAQVTRAADVATMTGANFSRWYRQDEGTFVASYSQIADITSGYSRAWAVGDGTNNNYIQNHINGGSNTNELEVRVNGTIQNAPAAFSSYLGASTTVAAAYKVLNTGLAKDGAAANQNLTTAQLPTVNILAIGTSATAAATTFLSGHISRLAYYPKRLTNATLVALSTP